MQYAAMMGGGENFQEIWSPDPGYSVNDVAKGGTRTYLKACDRETAHRFQQEERSFRLRSSLSSNNKLKYETQQREFIFL